MIILMVLYKCNYRSQTAWCKQHQSHGFNFHGMHDKINHIVWMQCTFLSIKKICHMHEGKNVIHNVQNSEHTLEPALGEERVTFILHGHVALAPRSLCTAEWPDCDRIAERGVLRELQSFVKTSGAHYCRMLLQGLHITYCKSRY